MVAYTVTSESFPSPSPLVDLSEPVYSLNPFDGSTQAGSVDVTLRYIDLTGVEQTVQFTASEDDPMDYGRQMYADIMANRVAQLGTIKTPVWDGPPPPPEPTPEQVEIAELKEQVAALTALVMKGQPNGS